MPCAALATRKSRRWSDGRVINASRARKADQMVDSRVDSRVEDALASKEMISDTFHKYVLLLFQPCQQGIPKPMQLLKEYENLAPACELLVH